MGVRSLVAEEGRELQRMAQGPICDFADIAQTVHAIAHHLHPMGLSIRDSETFSHLRSLYLETESYLNASQTNSEVAQSGGAAAGFSTLASLYRPLKATAHHADYKSA